MSEETDTPKNSEDQLLARASEASKNLEPGYRPAKPVAAAGEQKKWTPKEMWRDLTPKERRSALTGLGVGAAVVGAIAAGGVAASVHADQMYNNTIKHPDPMVTYDFDNGPTPPPETSKPAPSPSEIPSPTQSSIDVQLPTVPNNGTDLNK